MKNNRILPGFKLTLGFTIFYLCLMVLIPLSTLFFKTATTGWEEVFKTLTNPRIIAAFKLSFGASFLSALIDGVAGFVIAWVLVRYDFPFKKFMDALVDLPFALPTAVAGICLTTVYAPSGFMGKFFYSIGIPTAFTPIGIIIALTFIGLPFVVRTIEPVLQDLDAELEQAAWSLGASRWQTFYKVIFPTVFPALLTGCAMAFARALGEYGSVVFIAGNMPMKTEIIPLLIMTQLEQYNYAGATAIAAVMLVFSFILLLILNTLNAWSRRYQEA